ncbi:hypothetical protein DRO33_00745, partial [Candidatus Bathyarchaeota archaeon]
MRSGRAGRRGARILYVAHYCRPREAAWISTTYLIRALRRTGLVNSVVVLTNDPYASEVAGEGGEGTFNILVVPFPRALERSRLGKLLRTTLGYVFVLLYGLRATKRRRVTHIFT